jgi:hypothetical protein
MLFLFRSATAAGGPDGMFVMVLIPDLFHNIGSIILCREEHLRLMGRRGTASSIFGTVAGEMQCLRSSA